MASCVWDGSALLGSGGSGGDGGEWPLRRLASQDGRRALVAGGCLAYDPVSRLVVGGHRDGTVTAWHAAPLGPL
jgi:hypothetical protein